MVATASQMEAMAGPILVDESITQAEFARRVGCTRANINKLVKTGKLTLNAEKKLDYYQALADYENNTDPSHHERIGKTIRMDLQPAGDGHESAPGVSLETSTSNKLKEARAKREGHQADLAEIKLAKEAGQLIDAAKVEKDAFNLARRLRDAILTVPKRVAPILAAEQNDGRVEQILNEELLKALNGLASHLKKELPDADSQ